MTVSGKLITASLLTFSLAGCTTAAHSGESGNTRAPSRSPVSTTPVSAPAWQLDTIPELAGPTSTLRAVAAADATHAWAVGQEGYSAEQSGTTGQPVILHWDGSRWSRDEVQGAGWVGAFDLVAAGSPTDAWAVGFQWMEPAHDSVPRVYHQDGNGWREIQAPVGTTPGETAITGLAVTGGHAWLSGRRSGKPFILEWDGDSWRTHEGPAECRAAGPAPVFCTLAGVTAFAPDDVWITGNGGWPGYLGPALFHWDGQSWTTVKVGTNGEMHYLVAAAGRSAAEMWAVGNLFNSAEPFVVRNSSTAWTTVTGVPAGVLAGVTIDATGRPWALVNTSRPSASLVTTGDEQQWSAVACPQPAGSIGTQLNGITAVPGTGVMFAAGSASLPTASPTLRGFILRYGDPPLPVGSGVPIEA